MSSLSAPAATQQYELWLFHANGDVQPLPECGSWESRRQAEQSAWAIRDWFHCGIWPMLLDLLPPDAQDDFFFQRKGMIANGENTSLVRVVVKPIREQMTAKGPALVIYDPQDDQGDDRDDNDPSDDDTDLALPDVVYVPGEA